MAAERTRGNAFDNAVQRNAESNEIFRMSVTMLRDKGMFFFSLWWAVLNSRKEGVKRDRLRCEVDGILACTPAKGPWQ